MITLSNLNDKQNILLTQLSYESDVLKSDYNEMTIEEIHEYLIKTGGNKSTCEKLQKLMDADLGKIRIKAVGNDPITGFGAIAFTDESGVTGFSYRGTDGLKVESLNDWGDNLSTMITGVSPQSAQAIAFYEKYKDDDGNNYLYGHSKGGELSEYVYTQNYDEIKEIHLLNPQPINPYSLRPDQREAMKSDKVDIVIVEGDYVWFLGRLPSYGNIRIANSNGEDSHSYSSIEDMFDKEGNITQGNQPWWEYAAYFTITSLTSGLQFVGAGIGFTYNCVVDVVDYVRKDLYLKAKEFIVSVTKQVEKIGNQFKKFSNELKEFLGSVVDKARDWYNKNLNVGYKYASANPQITVDTYKLKNYGQRLQLINRRVSNLDGRLDSLYWQVGLVDLWSLIQADMLTGYSWRLDRCISYLNETASDFERMETNLLTSL